MPSPQFILGVLAAIITAVLYNLAGEFHADGVLAELQDALQVLFVAPFLLSAIVSGNVHAPAGGVFFMGLFLEIYLFLLVFFWLFAKVRRREQRPQP